MRVSVRHTINPNLLLRRLTVLPLGLGVSLGYCVSMTLPAYAVTTNSTDLADAVGSIDAPASSSTSIELTAPVSPFDVPHAGFNTSTLQSPPTPSADAQSLSLSPSPFQPTLVGVSINGSEVGNFDALTDTRYILNISNTPNIPPNTDDDSAITPSLANDNYYLSIETLGELTAVTFNKVQSENTLDKTAYMVITPLGDAMLTDQQVVTVANVNNTSQAVLNTLSTDYVALTTLKRLGISAEYNAQDLAIKLNMGWRPEAVRAQANRANTNDISPIPVDYYPATAGLLGLSFNSGYSVTEDARRIDVAEDDRNASNRSRQLSANIGAFGYGAGGVWGVSGAGYDTQNRIGNDTSTVDTLRQRGNGVIRSKSFERSTIDGITTLPWDWQDWELDNLYWAKSGQQYATRIGINQPNSLGRGAQVSGAQFTGAMLAYSNRSIERHLTSFDHNSDSLLENTSQDYQHLSGTAQPGGVAELRINGQAVARVQIALDGRYEFLNLNVNALDLTATLVEIAIYEYPTATQPLEIRPMFLGKRRTNVATGELLVEAGLGRTGNALSDNNHHDRYANNTLATHMYGEYGINNRVAVRAGVNTVPSLANREAEVAWHTGVNFTPTQNSNADLSYAHAPTQDVWQADLNYQHDKLWIDYQYQAQRYRANALLPYRVSNLSSSLPLNPLPNLPLAQLRQNGHDLLNQRHQLLLSYRPSDDTTINFNQYYNDLERRARLDPLLNTVIANNPAVYYVDNSYIDNTNDYYAYASVYHRFNERLNGGVTWDSRDDNYTYRLLWQDIPKRTSDIAAQSVISQNVTDAYRDTRDYQRNSLGLSGNNNSETLTLRHVLDNQTSLGQSISHLHGADHLLYRGDISHIFANNSGLNSGFGNSALSNQINIGYSLYDNNVGWQADWQLAHRNGLRFSLGYQHQYVSSVPNHMAYNITDNALNNVDYIGSSQLPWTQDKYLYARLSFDMFKSPTQPLRFGRVMSNRNGSVIVDISHPPEPPIDAQNMRFMLNEQSVQASLLNAGNIQSQYLINNIKAGDYTLTLDAKNLPIEYSTNNISIGNNVSGNSVNSDNVNGNDGNNGNGGSISPTITSPRIRVANYAPTAVPITLQKSFAISGKLADNAQDVTINVYRDGELMQTLQTGSYGYFQIFGLLPAQYVLQAEGYKPKTVTIEDDFILQLILEPEHAL